MPIIRYHPPDNEITTSTFVQLDLNNLLSGYNNFKFAANSTTSGEQWKYCFSSAAGSFGSTPCNTGSTDTAFNSLGNSLGARYFSLSAYAVPCTRYCDDEDDEGSAPNVLLYKFSADTTTQPTTPSAVPEPGSMILAGSGLLALYQARRRFKGVR